jgi:hypothetical protein
VPGVETVILGRTSWDETKTVLNAQGYQISSPVLSKDGVTQQHGVLINDPRQKNSISHTQVGATIFVLNNRVIGVVISLRTGNSSYKFTENEWRLVDPSILFSNYGTPDDLQVRLNKTGEGFISNIHATWKHLGVSVGYDLLLLPKQIKGEALQICVSPSYSIEVSASQTSPDRNIVQLTAQLPPGVQSRNFTAGMFTGISDLKTLWQALADGKCLETPLAFWQ